MNRSCSELISRALWRAHPIIYQCNSYCPKLLWKSLVLFAPSQVQGVGKNEMQWKEQNEPLLFNHPLCASQINIYFNAASLFLVESAAHLYKYQRYMRLMISSGVNEELGLQRGAVGAAGTLAEFKGKPGERQRAQDMDPAACSCPTALHLTLTSHREGLFVCG